jgi:hypothetical protein
MRFSHPKTNSIVSGSSARREELGHEIEQTTPDTQVRFVGASTAHSIDEIYMLVQALQDEASLESSLAALKMITGTDWFNTVEISWPPWLAELLFNILTSSTPESASLVECAIQFLTNVWRFDSGFATLFSEPLFAAVVVYAESLTDNLVRAALCAMANVATFMPHFFDEYSLNEHLVQYLHPATRNGFIDPLARFLLAIARCGNHDLFTPIIPHLVLALRTPIHAVKGRLVETVAILIQCEDHFELLFENDLLNGLFHALAHSDAAKTQPIFASFLVFVRHSIVEPFMQTDFAVALSDTLQQHFTIPADPEFELIRALLQFPGSPFWQVMCEAGLLEGLVDLVSLVVFRNRMLIFQCFLQFFEVADPPTAIVVGRDLGVFHLLCQELAFGQPDFVKQALGWIVTYVDIAPEFLPIALDAGLQDILTGLDPQGDPDILERVDALMNALAERDDAGCDTP